MNAPEPLTRVPLPLLSLRDLDVRFGAGEGEAIALDRVSLDIFPGEIFGLIGETGAGKSLTAWAALDLLPRGARRTGGEVWFAGTRLTDAPPRVMRQVRGSGIGVVVQNPIGALDPTRRIGDQLADAYLSHQAASRREARARAIEGFRTVGIADPVRRARAYPHELSGGMAQRVLIAIALINRPRLVIADEPTTGLDVTIQAEILDLMTALVHRAGSAIWIITHDLGIIANHTERAGVMFAGEIVETAATRDLFLQPQHPYTICLLDAQSATPAQQPRGGLAPDLVHRPAGCQFQHRCPWVEPRCTATRPELVQTGAGHWVRCFVAQRQRAVHADARL
jgi:peptide/nickel transport system ATP-binding protein